MSGLAWLSSFLNVLALVFPASQKVQLLEEISTLKVDGPPDDYWNMFEDRLLDL